MMRAALVLILLMTPAAADADWWDGFAAPPAGQGLDGEARVLHVHDDDLYAGGTFSDAGGVTAWFTARWDGDGWHAVGSGTNHRIDALCTYDGHLIAGGRFTEAGAVAVEYIAAWDGQVWSPIGMASWTWGYVLSLTEHEGDLYAGGTNYVAMWNGTVWQAITGTGFTGDVFALASYDGKLIAGGAFPAIVNPGGGSVAATNVSQWTGSEWLALGGGANGSVYTLEVHGDDIVAGGVFSSPGALIAAWNGGSWYAPGGGLVGSFVTALDSWGGRLLVGGDFTGGGAVAMTRIGVLDGSDWEAMGDGVNGMVRAIAGQGTEVFAGGAFSYAGGLPSQYVGRWDDPNVGVDDAPAAGLLRMSAPFPNPANPSVAIPLHLATGTHVRLDIFDVAGRRIRTLWDGHLTAGEQVFTWDGTTDEGRASASGAYTAHASTADGVTSQAFALVR
jgi:trimeric autotransporter adhesin